MAANKMKTKTIMAIISSVPFFRGSHKNLNSVSFLKYAKNLNFLASKSKLSIYKNKKRNNKKQMLVKK